MYNASKDSVISMLGNTLIQICVFDRKKTPAISIPSNNIIDRKDVQIYLWDRIPGIEHFIYGDWKYSLV